MKFCLRAILGIWLKIEDKILLDDCNNSPNLVTSSACFFWKKFEKSIFVLHLNSTCFCFFKKWYFFADLSFFEMKFCLRAILGIWLKIEDKILLDDCNHSPNLLTSSGSYFEKCLKNQYLFCIWIQIVFVFSKNDIFLEIFHFLRWNFVLEQSWEFGWKLRTIYF